MHAQVPLTPTAAIRRGPPKWLWGVAALAGAVVVGALTFVVVGRSDPAPPTPVILTPAPVASPMPTHPTPTHPTTTHPAPTHPTPTQPTNHPTTSPQIHSQTPTTNPTAAPLPPPPSPATQPTATPSPPSREIRIHQPSSIGDLRTGPIYDLAERSIPQLRRCREAEPSSVTVQLLVSPNGRIAIAQPNPNGPHGNTQQARCVANVLKDNGPLPPGGGIALMQIDLPAR